MVSDGKSNQMSIVLGGLTAGFSILTFLFIYALIYIIVSFVLAAFQFVLGDKDSFNKNWYELWRKP